MTRTKIDVRNYSFYYRGHQRNWFAKHILRIKDTPDVKALKNVSLSIPERKVTAIIGASGCGKSTLLRSINRIFELYPRQEPEGSILLDGKSIFDEDVDLLRARVGMVFQKPTVFPMSIRENIAFGIRLYERLPKSELDDRVRHALLQAALWGEVSEKLDESAHALSGGQQQRLCIARMYAIKPDVILLDEPCSALDPISTAKIEDLIDTMIKDLERECTIVIVTHNMHQADRLSDLAAFMHLGELIEFGETDQIFNRPRVKLTEDYITGRFG